MGYTSDIEPSDGRDTEGKDCSNSVSGWDNNGKPGNQVAKKSLPSHEIFDSNPVIITIYVKFIY